MKLYVVSAPKHTVTTTPLDQVVSVLLLFAKQTREELLSGELSGRLSARLRRSSQELQVWVDT